jgi:hypothetical protein
MANKINSYADFQKLMDDCCDKVGADPDVSGHGRWWRDMPYQEFMTTGVVKNERVVALGDPNNSIMIHALRGDTPDFTPTGRFKQMPKNGTGFFEATDIDEIADWIGRGCPDPSNPKPVA